jgi:electron transfer flavoprotein beta subunit
VATVGTAAARDAMPKALATGADSGLHVMDDALARADAAATASALAAALSSGGFDLIIAGNVSTDGRGGVVPAMVAEYLDLPQLSSMDSIEITTELVSGERTVDAGTKKLHATLPAVFTVTERMGSRRRWPRCSPPSARSRRRPSSSLIRSMGATSRDGLPLA